MTEYRWTEEAVDRAKALVEGLAATELKGCFAIEARAILDSIKVDPVEETIADLFCKSGLVRGGTIEQEFRKAIHAGIELGKKEVGL